MENEDQSIDYEQLFGIELNDDREDNSGTADPEGEIDDGMQEAAPHEEGAAEGTGDDDRGTETETQPQTQEDAAIARIRAEAQQELDAFVEAMGISNPYTDTPIKSKAEYDAYQKQHADHRREQFMQANGMSQEQYDQFVQSLPEVQRANQVMQEAKATQEQARAQQAKAVLDEQIAKISEMDPAIKTVEDLMGSDHYDQVYGLVKDGYRLADAYKLANFDRLTRRTAAASRQQAHNQAMGKRHLQQTQARGNGAVEVPGNIRQAYRELMPNATDAEIRENYARYLKSNERRN